MWDIRLDWSQLSLQRVVNFQLWLLRLFQRRDTLGCFYCAENYLICVLSDTILKIVSATCEFASLVLKLQWSSGCIRQSECIQLTGMFHIQASWTTKHSFDSQSPLHVLPKGPGILFGSPSNLRSRVVRAAVWRLRSDCYAEIKPVLSVIFPTHRPLFIA
jgi:hypothetical protein